MVIRVHHFFYQLIILRLFNHYLLAIVDIDAALRRLPVEGVPRIRTINHEP